MTFRVWVAALSLLLTAPAMAAEGDDPNASPAGPDEIVFLNGDRWTGRFVSLVEGKVTFETDLVGELEVPAEKVRTFRIASDAEVHLGDGTVLVDGIDTSESGSVRTRGAGAMGEQQVLLSDTVAINPPAPEPPGWHGKLVAGLDFERGNSHKNSAHGQADAAYSFEDSRLGFRASYDGERTKNSSGSYTTSDRNYFGRILYDYFLTEHWGWFVRSSAEKDGPSDLQLRFIASAGPTYNVWPKREDLDLLVRLGPTWVSENFDGGMDDDFVAGQINWDFLKKFNDHFELYQDGEFTQSFENADDELAKIDTGIRTGLTEHLFLEGKVVWEWDSQPSATAERQDVDYILGLGYKF